MGTLPDTCNFVPKSSIIKTNIKCKKLLKETTLGKNYFRRGDFKCLAKYIHTCCFVSIYIQFENTQLLQNTGGMEHDKSFRTEHQKYKHSTIPDLCF